MGVRWRRPAGCGTVDNIHCSGSYTIYLSHRPMPVDNWISTGAYKEAVIFCRWLLAGELPEQPGVEMGRLEDWGNG